MHCDCLIKLADGGDLRHALRLSRALIGTPQELVLQEDALQGIGQVPVVDLIEALRVGEYSAGCGFDSGLAFWRQGAMEERVWCSKVQIDS